MSVTTPCRILLLHLKLILRLSELKFLGSKGFELGLDIEEFSLCLDSKKYESRVAQLTNLAQDLGSTGTPTLFIGDSDRGFTQITGAQPYSVYSKVISEYLQ